MELCGGRECVSTTVESTAPGTPVRGNQPELGSIHFLRLLSI